jgi:hypothetical protein
LGRTEKNEGGKINRPTKFWQEFRKSVYGNDPIPVTQDRECSLSFYAGMQAAFLEVVEISAAAENEDDGAEAMDVFMREIVSTAMRANLDRRKS